MAQAPPRRARGVGGAPPFPPFPRPKPAPRLPARLPVPRPACGGIPRRVPPPCLSRPAVPPLRGKKNFLLKPLAGQRLASFPKNFHKNSCRNIWIERQSPLIFAPAFRKGTARECNDMMQARRPAAAEVRGAKEQEVFFKRRPVKGKKSIPQGKDKDTNCNEEFDPGSG